MSFTDIINNFKIEGDLTILSNSNTSFGSGNLEVEGKIFTNNLSENTNGNGNGILIENNTTLGTSLDNLDTYFKLRNTSNSNNATSSILFENDTGSISNITLLSSTASNANLLRIDNSSGDIVINSSSNKGLSISTDGIIKLDNTVNSSSSNIGGFVLSGGISISNSTNAVSSTNGGTFTTAGGAAFGKNVFIGGTLNALLGLHSFINEDASDVIKIQNNDIIGFSSIAFYDKTGQLKLKLGYANDGTSTPYTSRSFIQTNNGSDLLIRPNLTNSMLFNTNGSIELFSTLASTNSTTGSLKMAGGLSISNTTNATSIINGGSLTTAGGIAVAKDVYVGGAVLTTSDMRLKTNIIKIKEENFLDKVENIPCVYYSPLNIDTYNKIQLGFIAQDVVKYFPELVSKNNDYYSLDYSRMVVVLLKCIKELNHKYKDLIDKFNKLA